MGPLLVVAPAGTLAISIILYLALSPWLPNHIVRHVGTDGLGTSPTILVLAIMFAAAVVPFLIGGTLARGFFRDGHWHPTQKFVAIAFMSAGYGILGVALATMVSVVGLDPDEVSSNSVAVGLLGFLLLFTIAACAYAALLPRAEPEPDPSTTSSL